MIGSLDTVDPHLFMGSGSGAQDPQGREAQVPLVTLSLPLSPWVNGAPEVNDGEMQMIY